MNQEINFNYDQICEFSNVGCEESGFTIEGLKRHNEEYITKHLFLMKNYLEKNETKNEQEISKIKNDQVEMSSIIAKLSKKIEGNEQKSNELFTKYDEIFKKIEKIEENEKKYLGNKLKRDEKTIDLYGCDIDDKNNQNIQNKKKKYDNEQNNNSNNYNSDNLNKSRNYERSKHSEKSQKNDSKNRDNEKIEKIHIKKENEEEPEQNNKKEKEKEKEKEKISIKKKKEKEKEKQQRIKEKEKEKELKISNKFNLQKNKIEIIEEDSDSNKKNTQKEKVNNIMSNLKSISSNNDKEKEKDKSLKRPSIINITEKTNDYKFCRDSHILNNKKIRWEILLKKLTGYVALGISGKRPEEQTTVILDNDDNNDKVEEEIIPMANNDGILSSQNMHFLLTNEKNTIIWKNGSNYKKTNSDLPLLKEGDNLTLIYCPKFSQLKIQKGDYIFIFENVGSKTRQLLSPSVIFANKNDRAVFHNFQVLAEYNKK